MCIVHAKEVQLFYRTKMTADMSINVDFVVGKGGGGREAENNNEF